MMRATIKFDDSSKEFISRVAVFTDTMMALMAADIHNKIITKGRVPFLPHSTKWAQRGALRSSIRHIKLAVGHYAVTAGTGSPAAAYAAAQEAGMIKGSPIKNYSTPGTGAHWFRDAIDEVKSNASEYAGQAAKAAGIGGEL